MERINLGKCASASVRYIPGEAYEVYLSGGGTVKKASVKKTDGVYAAVSLGTAAYADEIIVLRDGRKWARRGAETAFEAEE